MNTNLSPFYATRQLFRDAMSSVISQDKISYQEWKSLPNGMKSCALYITFFDQIVLAWYKVKSFYAQEEEGVETMLQYLEKNVAKIEENESKYSEKYIYRVAYNCLYCICHDRVVDRKRWELEVSNIVFVDGDEIDLYDTVTDNTINKQLKDRARDAFWLLLDDLDPECQTLIDDMINGTSRSKMAEEKKTATIEFLQNKLAGFLPIFCTL